LYLSCFSIPTTSTALSTLSLHDALPISRHVVAPVVSEERGAIHSLDALLEAEGVPPVRVVAEGPGQQRVEGGIVRLVGAVPDLPDRKSTRLNSSHDQISYAVFCLKKKTE